MAEKNRVELTGTVEQLKPIKTKTGTPMAKWLLKVGDDRFWCVAFHNLAQVILDRGDGVQIGITGTGSINSWKTDQGHWRNDFQVTAWGLEIDGVAHAFEKVTQGIGSGRSSKQCQPAVDSKCRADRGQGSAGHGVQDYSGGPF